MADVKVSKDTSGRIIVSFLYDRSLVMKVKTIYGYRWHPDKKHWSFPNVDGTLDKILKVFEGERIQLDPALQEKLPFLFDQLHKAIETHHYSYRTEQTYVDWIKRFVHFHGSRHPSDLGEKEINAFLSHLAVSKHVSASTQY